MTLQVFLRHRQMKRWSASVNEQGGDLFGPAHSAFVGDYQHAVRGLNGETCCLEGVPGTIGIAGTDLKARRPQLVETAGIQFLYETPLVDDANAVGQPIHFGEDVAGHKDSHSFFTSERS